MEGVVLLSLVFAFVIRLLWIRKRTKRWRERYLPLHQKYREALTILKHAKILNRGIEKAEENLKKAEFDLRHWDD
jgi:hypothetical protein